MALPVVKLNQGIHVMHLFYRIDRVRWAALPADASAKARAKLEALCAANNNPSHPRVVTYANIGGKADLAFVLYAAEGAQLAQMHRDLEDCFPPGSLVPVYTFLSITELSEYATTEDDFKRQLTAHEKLEPGTDAFEKRLAEMLERKKEYEHYRLYPELPDWEIMGFYPMAKRRSGNDNWYSLDFDARKKLMGGHARVGRKFANKVTQLITSSTGLDDWEWGVTLVAHQMDALRDIVYEMRFDEVSARYGEFGPFYINLRAAVADLWPHLKL
ncbi:MAG: chlorite dismutase family protein [Verrucomicrobiota bacterium]